jgi:putative intracellular protease/amidase
MAKKQGSSEPQTDEHGLVVQRYASMVLVVVPEHGFGDEALRYARSCLYNVHVGTTSVSTRSESVVKGALQDEFLVDKPLSGASLDGYVGVLFAGGPGARELAEHPDALRLAREAAAAGKLVAAWGEAVRILARAGVLRGRRVTGPAGEKAAVRKAGGRFTGNQVERDAWLVTAVDDSAGMRFGKALVQVVAIG